MHPQAIHTGDVGSSQSRTRKPHRHLPKVPKRRESDTPPVMWPEPGSGFEASPNSPAGFMQGTFRAITRKERPTERQRNQATLASAVLVALVLLGAVVGLLIHLFG